MSKRQNEDDNLIAVFEEELYKIKYDEFESPNLKLNLTTPNFFK